MLTTAKSIQLLDVSGMNISPITDITSLYYEVQHSQNDNIITRKYVYDGFPVFVNISNDEIPQIGVARTTSERHPSDGPLYDNGQFYKLINKTYGSDILISNVSTDIVPGTTLRQINITNYNLSKILSYYTPLDLMDASINTLDISIDNINSSIRDISTRVADISRGLNAESCTLYELMVLAGKAQPIQQPSLVPNKFYLINNYYAHQESAACMKIPNNDYSNFSGPTKDTSLSLLVKTTDSANLDGKLYEMYDNSTGNALKVYGTYKLSGESGTKPLIQITYMKDQYGNEAPYDFYNLTYKHHGTKFLHTFSRIHPDTSTSVKNNIIKTDPFISYHIPIFDITVESSSHLQPSDYILKILNNYIGPNNNIYISSENENIEFINNIIDSSNQIVFTNDENGEGIYITNTNIQNNNTFKSTGYIAYNNINIGNNNIIQTRPDDGQIYHINNLIINSSNNITLYNDGSNITILNNCDGSINLSDNIIIDNYINTAAANSSLNTSPNSVYLFKQDVYAKSFNTLK